MLRRPLIIIMALAAAIATFKATAQDASAKPGHHGMVMAPDDRATITPDEDPGTSQAPAEETDSIGPTVVVAPGYTLEGKREFNPDPGRACWMSALLPGLGQIYNRRYWKLPIIVAGFMGLGYGTSWNARMFHDYQIAYQDIMDDDPDTKSYLDFFPPNVDESSLDKSWLEQTFKNRKDFYRRNRDLCIIGCVGVYLLCMIDAYVDAHLSHFDISPSISMDVAPAIINNPSTAKATAAIFWTLTF